LTLEGFVEAGPSCCIMWFVHCVV